MIVKLPTLNRIASSIFSSWMLQVATLLFGLTSVSLITNKFGIEGLGLWMLVQSIAGQAQILELGIASSLTHFLSRDKALSKTYEYTAHASSAIVTLAGIGLVLILVALPITMIFPVLYEIPQHFSFDAIVVLTIAIITIGFTLPLRSAHGIISSQHRFSLISHIELIGLLVKFVLIVIVCKVINEGAFIALAIAVYFSNMIVAFGVFIGAVRIAPCTIFNLRTASVKYARELVDVGLYGMMFSLSAGLLRHGAPLIIGYSISVLEVPYVALPLMLVGSLAALLGVLNQIMLPIFSHMAALQNTLEQRNMYLIAAKYNMFFALFIFSGVLLVMPYLLPLWLNEDKFGVAGLNQIYVNMMLIFGGYCLATPAFIARTFLLSVGEHKVAAKGELISVLVGLVVGWTLMVLMKLGAIGMAGGIATAYLLRATGMVMRQTASFFNMPKGEIYGQVWWQPFLCAMPLLLVSAISQILGISLIGVIVIIIVALSFSGFLVFKKILIQSHQIKLSRLFHPKS
jgi:O-antigen/teichoic acid export membrane protein